MQKRTLNVLLNQMVTFYKSAYQACRKNERIRLWNIIKFVTMKEDECTHASVNISEEIQNFVLCEMYGHTTR